MSFQRKLSLFNTVLATTNILIWAAAGNWPICIAWTSAALGWFDCVVYEKEKAV